MCARVSKSPRRHSRARKCCGWMVLWLGMFSACSGQNSFVEPTGTCKKSHRVEGPVLKPFRNSCSSLCYYFITFRPLSVHTHRSSACVTAHTPSPLLRSSSVAIVLRRCPSGHRLQHGPRREDTARRYGTDGKQANKQKQQPSTPIFMRRSNIESEISWPSPEHHRTPRAHKTLHDHAPLLCVCAIARDYPRPFGVCSICWLGRGAKTWGTFFRCGNRGNVGRGRTRGSRCEARLLPEPKPCGACTPGFGHCRPNDTAADHARGKARR